MTRGFRTSCARYYLSLVGFVTNRKSTWSPSREDEICFLSTRIPRSVNRVQFGMSESIKRKTAANWLVMRQKTTFQCFLCCFSFSDCPRLNQSALNICLCFCSIYTRFDFRRSFIFFFGVSKMSRWLNSVHTHSRWDAYMWQSTSTLFRLRLICLLWKSSRNSLSGQNQKKCKVGSKSYKITAIIWVNRFLSINTATTTATVFYHLVVFG